MDSITNSDQQIKQRHIAAVSSAKVTDIKPGDEVVFNDRLYRVVADGQKGTRLWFIAERPS